MLFTQHACCPSQDDHGWMLMSAAVQQSAVQAATTWPQSASSILGPLSCREYVKRCGPMLQPCVVYELRCSNRRSALVACVCWSNEDIKLPKMRMLAAQHAWRPLPVNKVVRWVHGKWCIHVATLLNSRQQPVSCHASPCCIGVVLYGRVRLRVPAASCGKAAASAQWD